jgi:hypothetical protein
MCGCEDRRSSDSQPRSRSAVLLGSVTRTAPRATGRGVCGFPRSAPGRDVRGLVRLPHVSWCETYGDSSGTPDRGIRGAPGASQRLTVGLPASCAAARSSDASSMRTFSCRSPVGGAAVLHGCVPDVQKKRTRLWRKDRSRCAPSATPRLRSRMPATTRGRSQGGVSLATSGCVLRARSASPMSPGSRRWMKRDFRPKRM